MSYLVPPDFGRQPLGSSQTKHKPSSVKTIPNSIPNRVVLYPKDVENITGLRASTARKLIRKIREALGKSKK